MALVASEMKDKFRTRIKDGLKRVYAADVAKGNNYTSEAEAAWDKMADAISDIAMDIVTELTTNASVLPGQAVVGVGGGVPGPMSGTTVSPGQIV